MMFIGGLIVGAVIGYFGCAMMTVGNVSDAHDAHARAVDAKNTMQARIERALECVTENSAHVGKKMAAILKGERL